MGLSSKQVSCSGGIDWSQTLLQDQTLVDQLPKNDIDPPPPMRPPPQVLLQQQSAEQLKCPRCDSANTKFCYYNNYNKSQPRHFCKACKRHWTRGGTLRNVPVGGGRKNRRLKASNTSAKAASIAATSTSATTSGQINNRTLNPHKSIHQTQQQGHNFPFTLGDEKNISEIPFQAMIRLPSPLLPQQDSIKGGSLETKNFSTNNIIFTDSTLLPLSQNQSLGFPFSSSFETNPSPVSSAFQSSNISNVYNYSGETIDDPTIAGIIPTTSSGVMDMSSYWNWDDINTLVSTDLNIPWDDSEIIKP